MGPSLSGRRDYQSLRDAQAQALAGRTEAANQPENTIRPEAGREQTPERTELEWAEAVEARKGRILEGMRADGASPAELVWKERQIASEPTDDHIRAIKSEEEAERRGSDATAQAEVSTKDRGDPYGDAPQRPLTKDEKRARILEAGEKFEKEQEQQNSNSNDREDRDGGGRDR